MKLISGWIGVLLVFFSLSLQLWILLTQKKHHCFFVVVQFIVIISSIFWMVYAFSGYPIYWPTGINNVFIFCFNSIFMSVNFCKWRQLASQKKDNKEYE